MLPPKKVVILYFVLINLNYYFKSHDTYYAYIESMLTTLEKARETHLT